MQTNIQTTWWSHSLSILLLFGVTNPQIDICGGSQIPERFFYNNNGRIRLNVTPGIGDANVDTSATSHGDDAGIADTKVKLLDDSRKDPIPLEFYEEMNNITDISDFIHRFVAEDNIDPQLGLQQKFFNNVERAAANIPKPAGCEPQSEIVELLPLNPSTDREIFYYPKCTRVKRCSGCCNSPLLSCQPNEEEVIDFQVVKYRYLGNGKKMRAEGQEHVLIKQHNSCKCDCRIKKEDCNSYQVYDPSMCRCICTNTDERQKCFAQEEKLWDYDSCKCRCRDEQSCTTGTVFDESQCKCIEPLISGSMLFDRRRFILKAIPVESK